MKMKAANSKDCQRLLLCQLNGQVASQSLNNWHLGQVCSLGLAKMAGGRASTTASSSVARGMQEQEDVKQLLLAGHYGRLGLNCTAIYDECGLEEQRFIHFSQLLPWSPMGELKSIRNLVSWIWLK